VVGVCEGFVKRMCYATTTVNETLSYLGVNQPPPGGGWGKSLLPDLAALQFLSVKLVGTSTPAHRTLVENNLPGG